MSVFISLESTIPGGPGVDYPTFSVPPPTSFSCQGLVQGYYADQVSPDRVDVGSIINAPRVLAPGDGLPGVPRVRQPGRRGAHLQPALP